MCELGTGSSGACAEIHFRVTHAAVAAKVCSSETQHFLKISHVVGEGMWVCGFCEKRMGWFCCVVCSFAGFSDMTKGYGRDAFVWAAKRVFPGYWSPVNSVLRRRVFFSLILSFRLANWFMLYFTRIFVYFRVMVCEKQIQKPV